MEATNDLVPEIVGRFGCVQEGDKGWGVVQFIGVGIGKFVDSLLQASLCDCLGGRVFHEVIIVVKEESVLFTSGEARHGGCGVASGFAGEVVTAVVAKVEEGFVVCMSTEPERLERMARVARGFGHEESVPKGSGRTLVACSCCEWFVAGSLYYALVVYKAEH